MKRAPPPCDTRTSASARHFASSRTTRKGQYCTTLIWYAWQHAGVDLGARFEYLSVPLSSGHYLLLPHSLRSAKRLRLLYEMDLVKK
ncbi:MAG: hypothetical protein LBU11_12245 [Zoogloeaceae bacterium]|jgi:hypothetical protein|nr:hypothetical protein [Zoogloeaceae bacterium]